MPIRNPNDLNIRDRVRRARQDVQNRVNGDSASTQQPGPAINRGTTPELISPQSPNQINREPVSVISSGPLSAPDEFLTGFASNQNLSTNTQDLTTDELEKQKRNLAGLEDFMSKAGFDPDKILSPSALATMANVYGSPEELTEGADRAGYSALLVLASQGQVPDLENAEEFFEKICETIGMPEPIVPSMNTAESIQEAAKMILKQCFGNEKAIPAVRADAAFTEGFSLDKINLGSQLSMLAYQSEEAIARQLPLLGLDVDTLQIVEDEKHGSFGFVVADAEGNVFTSFRGTESESNDVLTDANIFKRSPGWADGTGIRVHTGFERALSPIWGKMVEAIENCRGDGGKLHFSGHSLGGAVAQMAAARAILTGVAEGSDISIVTAGAPRGGNKRYARFLDRNIGDNFRVVHESERGRKSDIVTGIPPKFLGYRHAGSAVFVRPDEVKRVEARVQVEARSMAMPETLGDAAMAPPMNGFAMESAGSVLELRTGAPPDDRDPGLDLVEGNQDLDALRALLAQELAGEEDVSELTLQESAPPMDGLALESAPRTMSMERRPNRINLHRLGGYVGNVGNAILAKAAPPPVDTSDID